MKCDRLGLVCKSLLLGIALLSQGCQNSTPLVGSIVPVPLGADVVSDFNAASLKVNPALTGSEHGYFADESNGVTQDSGLILAPPPAGDSNAYALHLFGAYTDYGNAAYPAFQLDAFLRNDGNYFDASVFLNGIEFSWNCPSDDNSVQRFFCLVTARIAPQSAGGTGGCANAGNVPCYDYLSAVLPNTGGLWITKQIPFSTLAPEYPPSGVPTALNQLQPNELKQVLSLLWTNRSNNNNGNGAPPEKYTGDIWLDNIQFF
jgi:hypothetical protein